MCNIVSKHDPLFSLACKSLQVCREWEAEALKVNKDVRLALIRIGVVLGKDGGALGITNFQNSCLDDDTHDFQTLN